MKEITEQIKKIQDVAKIQKIGVDPKGRPRYMIYVTAAVKKANYKAGDKVVYSLYKITREEQIQRNTSNNKVCSVTPNPTEETEPKINEIPVEPDELDEAESEFVKKYKQANEIERGFIETKGLSDFGKERTKELIELTK